MFANPIKVLMIEDLQIAQMAALNIFKKLNCHIHIVSNAPQAFNKIFSHSFDIIFSDLQLPEMSGYQIAETLRSLQHNKRIPIIAVTANSNPDLPQLTKASGFDDFIVKPLTVESVRHLFSKYLSNRKCS